MSIYLDKTASLTPEAKSIICDKATEFPHSGIYNSKAAMGTYLCRRCGIALFHADSQFSSGCGWPSFDVEIPERVREYPDPDGRRMEILCNRCDGHLGHVFTGEHYTEKNRRYCVNSASLDFTKDNEVQDSEEGIFAGGCFWGIQYYFSIAPGVLKAESGYTGGSLESPTYQQICEGNTGHFEAVRVVFDTKKTNYESLLRLFFEIHNPGQVGGQGPDIGPQYQSAIFCYNDKQKQQAADCIETLKAKGEPVVTKLLPVSSFWPAEEYHQNYFEKHNKQPACHRPFKRF